MPSFWEGEVSGWLGLAAGARGVTCYAGQLLHPAHHPHQRHASAVAVRPSQSSQISFQPPTHLHVQLQVFILPTIRINGVQYRGKMATAEVLRAICAGFSAGNMPQACSKVGTAAAV